MNKPQVLFVSHRDRNCGVYQFGKMIARLLERSEQFDYRYVECGDAADLRAAASHREIVAVIYNHHPATAPWLTFRETRKSSVPQIGIVHEVTQELTDGLGTSMFDYHVAPDPTLLLRNPRVFKTGRFIPNFEPKSSAPDTPTIGSFGFATAGKNFDKLVARVQDEFDRATIRLHIPFARFGDADGARARAIAAQCRSLVTKPGIELDISHDFLDDDALLAFLEGNSLNAFLYEDGTGRGISSTIDYALAVNRPIAVSRSKMFRHVHGTTPSIVLEERSLRSILEAGTEPLRLLREEWSQENLIWDYDRIVSQVLAREGARPETSRAEALTKGFAYHAIERGRAVSRKVLPAIVPEAAAPLLAKVERKALRKIGYFGADTAQSGDWVPSSTTTVFSYKKGSLSPYEPFSAPQLGFNKILDDSQRALYNPTIDYLTKAAPDVIAHKIARANVQQAFVFDTVVRLAGPSSSARLLSVGSYEDTAAIALIRSGYDVVEVDPLLNYDLTTFSTKPSVEAGSFDVVLSTSVIEHVQDDEEFVERIASLLKPGGIAVLTCDFRDGFVAGDPMPAADRRLYTTRDLEQRLLSLMPGFEFVDAPTWRGVKPDFEYEGTVYSFATFVVRKRA